jgi:hypothetical protein
MSAKLCGLTVDLVVVQESERRTVRELVNGVKNRATPRIGIVAYWNDNPKPHNLPGQPIKRCPERRGYSG